MTYATISPHEPVSWPFPKRGSQNPRRAFYAALNDAAIRGLLLDFGGAERVSQNQVYWGFMESDDVLGIFRLGFSFFFFGKCCGIR
jgi:hypothetical protein